MYNVTFETKNMILNYKTLIVVYNDTTLYIQITTKL